MSNEINTLKCVFRPENVLFITQVLCIFVVICAALVNLTLQLGDQHIWTMILTSSLAAMLPSPKFRPILAAKESTNGIKDGEEEVQTPPKKQQPA